MSASEINVATPDGAMRAFTAHPDGDGPFPLAILFMDAAGYRDELKQLARRFAAAGYYCVVPDLWHHFGPDIGFDMKKIAAEGFKGPEIESMLDLTQKLTPELVAADTEALIAAVAPDAKAAAGPKVCVGYCMSARFALHTAATRPGEFVAAAGIHPGTLVTDRPDSPHHDLDTVDGELYFLFAEKDQYAPPEMVAALREQMADRGIPGSVETAPGTHHGFSFSDTPAYQPQASEMQFERTVELWDRARGSAID